MRLDGDGRSSIGECGDRRKGCGRPMSKYGKNINRALIASILLIIHQPIHLSKLPTLYFQS
jgi:hypothetical protein